MTRTPAILIASLAFALGVPAESQTAGPIPPARPTATPLPSSAADLPMPVGEIIQKFAAKESEFREARGQYSYKQKVTIQDYRESGRPGGRFLRESEVIFKDDGSRYERVTHEPPSTLERLSLTPEDMKDIESIQPFVLTSEDLPLYDVQFTSRERVDEIDTYVFRVRPKRIEPGQRYFEGTIWVDELDLQIVKTRGKAVPDIRGKKQENLFPVFETYRENIDGKYWFPTYTLADDVLHFSTGDVRIRIVVRYTDYKRRDVTVRILSSEPVEKKPPQP